ncbi:MAG TPA: HAMP domain-containing sensor histidine kinase [Pirellulales bacterium]|nr:HAMP domain-containing sensor histidine kinase [Pirellulales bacterium]
MLAKWPIRNKLLVGVGLLTVLVATLSTSGFLGLYAYRSLVRSLHNRAAELPLATELAQKVSDLRVSVTANPSEGAAASADQPQPSDADTVRDRFRTNFDAVQSAFEDYSSQLAQNDQDDFLINDRSSERAVVAQMQETIARLADLAESSAWPLDAKRLEQLNSQLDSAQGLSGKLPSFLYRRIHDLAGEVRGRYRTLIILTWLTTILALVTFVLLVHLFYRWVFRPLQVLLEGSRVVAAGNFGYRIQLDSQDEMAELARSLNDMTSRFQAIRDDLDHQVQLRTRQVVRSEQLASVGFLAAGVSHEINNPLASIAMCAESLEGRLAEIAPGDDPQSELVRRYLRMIQTEAFRCKEITEKLLDFSRLGDVQHQPTDLSELIQGVIDMVRHLGKYQKKQINFSPAGPVVAEVNGQEIKQVVLNMITNALDAVDSGGVLTIDLHTTGEFAEMVFTDNGCGMTQEVLEHLFEPFFTRKRGGQGTGLGLSIVYRIVSEHGGQIEATSAGPAKGSQLRITLPLAESTPTDSHKENTHHYQAA